MGSSTRWFFFAGIALACVPAWALQTTTPSSTTTQHKTAHNTTAPHHTTTQHHTTRHKPSAKKTVTHHAAVSASTSAQPSEQQVRELFDVMHLSQTFSQVNAQMTAAMTKALPCVPASYWQGYLDVGSTEQLLGRMVPVYQSHFTAGDVDGLLKFYRTPLGQKVITQMPLTMAEGMKVGQDWGHERSQQMVQTLQEEGKLDAQGRCPAVPAAGAPVGTQPGSILHPAAPAIAPPAKVGH